MADILDTLKKIHALELEKKSKTKEKNQIEAEKFSPKPQPPTKRSYPPINVKFRWKTFLIPLIICWILQLFFWPLSFAAIAWAVYYPLVKRKKHKQEDEDKIRNSPEYQAQCRTIDEEYESAKRIYDTETLPKYSQSLAEWEKEHDAKLRDIQDRLICIEEELSQLYQDLNDVPKQYHNPAAIDFIYRKVQSGDYDIEEACLCYEEKLKQEQEAKQRRAASERARQQEEARQRYAAEQAQQQESCGYSDSSGSFVRNAASAGLGAWAATSGMRHEQKKQTAIMQDQAKMQRQYEENRKREMRNAKHQQALNSQREWKRIQKINQERRRKGQPELPLPTRHWD